jgi:sulfhydrogenase subunit beta (sulfur reductase)
MQKILPKEKLSEFIDNLIKNKYEVIAPVKKGNTKFEKINSSKEIFFEKITEVPAKTFFMPENETLVEFKNGKAEETKEEIKKRIIFGLRKCDLNAIKVMDKVMFDPQYLDKRKNTILIGMHCESTDDYCFCNSMDLEDYYDLFFYPDKDDYYISVRGDTGKELVKNLPNAKKEVKLKIKNKKVLESLDIEKDYSNKIWEAESEKCLSCSSCSIYCPTCNCFDIRDILDINFKDGKRTRRQISCQLKSFSRVAGGKSYRDSRLSRFKHFVYHKIVYYKKQHGRAMCVGCGRCLRVCPPKIDWVDTINLLKEEEELEMKNKPESKEVKTR